MEFDEFCKINCMEDIEVERFKIFLEKKKDDLHPRSIQDWLNIFNIYFDNQ